MTASANDRCLKINILKWNMPCMHQNIWSLAMGEQICPKNVLSYHAEKSLFCRNMTITVSNEYTPQLKSATDQYIMQASYLDRYTASQQRDINLVLLYLQVMSLADLSDHVKNKDISLNYLDGVRPSDWTNNERWPRQHAPTSSQKRLWKRYLRSCFLRCVPYWKVPPLPYSAIPDPVAIEQNPTSYEDLSTYISRSLSLRHRRMLDSLEQVATDLQVWRAFRSKSRLHVASDGGLHKHQGTFGWIISTKKKVLFKCSGPVDGPFDTDSSTRCELCGVTSSLLLLVTLSRFWGIKHRCRIRWYCDSKTAISRIQRFASPRSNATSMPFDADLISLIASFRRELRCRFQPVWVKGHQDSLQSYNHLPISARLNVDADYLATR
jgi:ribonuclease HI